MPTGSPARIAGNWNEDDQNLFAFGSLIKLHSFSLFVLLAEDQGSRSGLVGAPQMFLLMLTLRRFYPDMALTPTA